MTIKRRAELVATFAGVMCERMGESELTEFGAATVAAVVGMIGERLGKERRPETIPDLWNRYVEDGKC